MVEPPPLPAYPSVAFVGGEYLAARDSEMWTSSDGITWSSEAMFEEFRGSRVRFYDVEGGAWATTSAPDVRSGDFGLWRLENERWVPVETNVASLEATVDLGWQGTVTGEPTRAGSIVVIPATMSDGQLEYPFLWVGNHEQLDSVAAPWSSKTSRSERVRTSVVALRDRFIAASFRTGAEPHMDLEMWRSFDGRAWDLIDLPVAVTEGLDMLSLQSGAGRLMLSTMNSLVGGPQSSTLWTSEDGEPWLQTGADARTRPGDVDLGAVDLHHTGSIWMAASNVASSSTGNEWIAVSLSEDGLTWESVPSGADLGTQGGFAAGFAGDALFVWVPSEAGVGVLWVGRLEG